MKLEFVPPQGPRFQVGKWYIATIHEGIEREFGRLPIYISKEEHCPYCVKCTKPQMIGVAYVCQHTAKPQKGNFRRSYCEFIEAGVQPYSPLNDQEIIDDYIQGVTG
jgi:hypothetical protein